MSESETSAKVRMRCREIMSRNVKTATPEMTLENVAVMMRDGDMGAVPVVENGKLVGIVTDRDIVVRAVAEGLDAATKIAEAMTTEIFSVKPDDFVFEAIRLMGDKQVRRIPVVGDNGELAGIIAMADVALEMEDEREIAETLEEISSGASFWRKIEFKNGWIFSSCFITDLAFSLSAYRWLSARRGNRRRKKLPQAGASKENFYSNNSSDLRCWLRACTISTPTIRIRCLWPRTARKTRPVNFRFGKARSKDPPRIRRSCFRLCRLWW